MDLSLQLTSFFLYLIETCPGRNMSCSSSSPTIGNSLIYVSGIYGYTGFSKMRGKGGPFTSRKNPKIPLHQDPHICPKFFRFHAVFGNFLKFFRFCAIFGDFWRFVLPPPTSEFFFTLEPLILQYWACPCFKILGNDMGTVDMTMNSFTQ